MRKTSRAAEDNAAGPGPKVRPRRRRAAPGLRFTHQLTESLRFTG
jgi:hypothetical protein